MSVTYRDFIDRYAQPFLNLFCSIYDNALSAFGSFFNLAIKIIIDIYTLKQSVRIFLLPKIQFLSCRAIKVNFCPMILSEQLRHLKQKMPILGMCKQKNAVHLHPFPQLAI
ncbi:MAG: hypothetical protein CMM50_02960 [Rhodospirillaceae bacterium]|nr:hypothetical protein [Rhodospirillaceae bacterium]